jgi:hypothetical protein
LHEELAVFFTTRGKMEFKDLYSQDDKMNQIAYLADMFVLLNQLNISLQGHNSSIIDLFDKMKSFQMKVEVYGCQSSKERRDTCFQFWLLALKRATMAQKAYSQRLNAFALFERRALKIFQTNSFLWSDLSSHLTSMKCQKLHKKNGLK